MTASTATDARRLSDGQSRMLAEIAEREAGAEPRVLGGSDLRAAHSLAERGLLAPYGTIERQFTLTAAGAVAYDRLPARYRGAWEWKTTRQAMQEKTDAETQQARHECSLADPMFYVDRHRDQARIEAEHDARPELLDHRGHRSADWYRAVAASYRARAAEVAAAVAAMTCGDEVAQNNDEAGTVWTVREVRTGNDGELWLRVARICEDGSEVWSGGRARAYDLVRLRAEVDPAPAPANRTPFEVHVHGRPATATHDGPWVTALAGDYLLAGLSPRATPEDAAVAVADALGLDDPESPHYDRDVRITIYRVGVAGPVHVHMLLADPPAVRQGRAALLDEVAGHGDGNEPLTQVTERPPGAVWTCEIPPADATAWSALLVLDPVCDMGDAASPAKARGYLLAHLVAEHPEHLDPATAPPLVPVVEVPAIVWDNPDDEHGQ